MTIVVNKYKEEYDVYIGRGSKWGNPHKISEHKNRDQVIEEYRKYLWKQIQTGGITIGELLELDGKRLGCFCKPKNCHGDVIVRAINWAKQKYQ